MYGDSSGGPAPSPDILKWVILLPRCRAPIDSGLIEHLVETQGTKAGRRTFQAVPLLAAEPGSCLALTPWGQEEIVHLLAGTGLAATATGQAGPAKPQWVARDYELWYAGTVVSKWTRAAPGQHPLLDAFEANGWAREVANPFTGSVDLPAANKLENAVKGLNLGQHPRVLLFSYSRDRSAARWEAVE